MPVTIAVADHPAVPWEASKAESDRDLLKGSCQQYFQASKGVVQSSFPRSFLEQNHISPSENGLVYAAYHAYSHHHHLTLRPDDVWSAILCQTGYFVNAHAEELRNFFVSHEGQKELEVMGIGSLCSADFGGMAQRMTEEIQKNVVDPDLRAWIMPTFSTTTETDRVVSAIMMMGAMQKYFSYKMTLLCGIPSVTLLGEREDWIDIQTRLEKLKNLGAEPGQFGELLKPIVRHFIKTFDQPDSPAVKEFWSRIAHQTGGSGPYYLSGWITAFCFWDEEGKSLYEGCAQPPVSLQCFQGRAAGCELDGVFYHRIDTDNIPSGVSSVPVTVDENGQTYHTKMIAGSVGILAIGSVADHEEGESQSLDRLRPASGWWMIEVDAPTEGEIPAAQSTIADDDVEGQSYVCRPLLVERLNELARAGMKVAA